MKWKRVKGHRGKKNKDQNKAKDSRQQKPSNSQIIESKSIKKEVKT